MTRFIVLVGFAYFIVLYGALDDAKSAFRGAFSDIKSGLRDIKYFVSSAIIGLRKIVKSFKVKKIFPKEASPVFVNYMKCAFIPIVIASTLIALSFITTSDEFSLPPTVFGFVCVWLISLVSTYLFFVAMFVVLGVWNHCFDDVPNSLFFSEIGGNEDECENSINVDSPDFKYIHDFDFSKIFDKYND